MNALPPSASPPHFGDGLSLPGDARGIGLLARDRDWQEQINRHTERAGDLLMQCNGTLAFPGFKLRQVALRDTDGYNQLGLRHLAPLAQGANGILASCQPIDYDLGEQDLVPAASDARARRTIRAVPASSPTANALSRSYSLFGRMASSSPPVVLMN